MNRILLIGSGWRARMWARVISALPDVSLAGVLCRNPEKRAPFEKIGVPVCGSYDEALSVCADAVLVCVRKQDNLAVSCFFAEKGYRVLCETPAGGTDEERRLFSESEVMIAEQYPLQPVFAAAQAVIKAGILGEVHTLRLSCCHDYHAVALMRALLGTGDRIPKITAHAFTDEYVSYAGREGLQPPQLAPNRRVMAYLDFEKKRAFYDWSYGQYFSQIRGSQFILQGTLGEINGQEGVCLRQGSVVPFRLKKVYNGQDGSLFAPDLVAICCMGKRVYENPFCGLRFSEEEIAMAQCLTNFMRGNGYSAKEAALDSLIAQTMENTADGKV